MKKLFFLFFILFAATDSSAIGLSEHNTFGGLKKHIKKESRGVFQSRVYDLKEAEQLIKRNAVVETRPAPSSVVGFISGFFSRVFSVFIKSYLGFSPQVNVQPQRC